MIFKRFKVYTIWDTGRMQLAGKHRTLEGAQEHARMVDVGAVFKHGVIAGVLVTGPGL